MSEPRIEHPSFGVVTVHRTTCRGKGMHLFQSPLQHSHIISLAIHGASNQRQHNRDWVMPEEQHVQVYMSMSQFGQMISSAGQGEGTPCTIARLNGVGIPSLRGEGTRETFEGEIKSACKKVGNLASETERKAIELLSKKTITKGDVRELLEGIAKVSMELQSNLPFIQEQFDNAMDKSLNVAKTEIEHFAAEALRRAGIKSMIGGTEPDLNSVRLIGEGGEEE